MNTTYQVRNNERIVKSSFLFTFFIGLVFILLSKIFLNQFAASAIAVAILFGYAFFLHQNQAYLREDQAGDNLYYMGFLFTLCSLSFALYQFVEEANTTEHIISNFALALVSTIVGVALRVFFNQMRVDPDEIARTSTIQLSQAAQKVKLSLDDSVVSFDRFKSHIQNELENSVQQTTDSTANAVSSILANFSDSCMEANSLISSASKNLDEAAKHIVEKIDQEFSQYVQSASKLNKETESYAEALSNASEKISELSDSLDNFILRTGEFSKEIEEIKTLSKASKKTNESLHDILEKNAESSKNVLEQSQSLKKVVSDIISTYENAHTAQANYIKSLKELTQSTKASGQSITGCIKKLEGTSHELNDRMKDQFLEAIDSTEKVHKSLRSLANNITDSLKKN